MSTQGVDPQTLEEHIQWLHDTRKKIDALINEVRADADLRRPNDGAEITLSFRALQTAKHWLGEALGKVAGPLPPEFADKADSNPAS